MVHLVLHPHGIAHIFLKFDALSPDAGFIPNISTKGINQIKKGIVRKNLSLMYKKIINTFLKKKVQFHVYPIE